MSESSSAMLEIQRLRSDHVDGLLSLLHSLEQEGTDTWFRPHPFTPEHLHRISRPDEQDVYIVMMRGPTVIGYGMLRGWAEGYAIPSLGIALHSDWRGTGLGALLMSFLHCAARLRGSTAVRLRVSRNNARAIALYTRTGYAFEELGEDAHDTLIVGIRTL